MKKITSICFVLFIVLVFTNSKCKKTIIPPIVYNAEFPNKIGTQWKYLVFDQVYNITDTVTVDIIGNDKFSDGRDVQIWKYSSNFLYSNNYPVYGIDSDYVYSSSAGISIYNSLNALAPKYRYEFPLSVGKTWDNNIGNTQVIQMGNHTIPLGIYNSYQLYDSANIIGNTHIVLDEWYCNNIGMIERNYFYRSGGSVTKQHWTLLFYKPN